MSQQLGQESAFADWRGKAGLDVTPERFFRSFGSQVGVSPGASPPSVPGPPASPGRRLITASGPLFAFYAVFASFCASFRMHPLRKDIRGNDDHYDGDEANAVSPLAY